ncbi:hypothetical protein AVEN_69537-1 [Araneus ventricosus]|uniref:Uncharacterized protein n=1 Tax=Araneus ventricosus TaxID=182803 RepID=A0A4Y2RPN0_ARAVE|nr:hypothetical protein AVEN_69537-1 [Araneus ventricosus]
MQRTAETSLSRNEDIDAKPLSSFLSRRISTDESGKQILGHPLCTNFAITKVFVDYVMHSSFAYRQFNSNFTCGDPTILPYELIHSRNRGTVVHNVRLPTAWQVFDV